MTYLHRYVCAVCMCACEGACAYACAAAFVCATACAFVRLYVCTCVRMRACVCSGITSIHQITFFSFYFPQPLLSFTNVASLLSIPLFSFLFLSILALSFFPSSKFSHSLDKCWTNYMLSYLPIMLSD